jgi:adenylate cyclase
VNVCFADLSGFTRLGERVDAEELGAVAERFADLAAEVGRPPVRLVKTIGDAAMLVSEDAPPLLEAALALVESSDAEGDAFPQVRAGIAAGEALPRGGDWYGHAVNLASRVCARARPGSVLTTADVKKSVENNLFHWSNAGVHHLKGVRAPVPLWRVRRRPGKLDP